MKDIYLDHALTHDETLALRNKSRAEGVSVNAALLAAILIAKNNDETKSLPNNLGFAVDVRDRLTKDAGEACNLLASGAMVMPEYKDSMTFWDLAKDIHTKTLQIVASNQSLFGTRLLAQSKPQKEPARFGPDGKSRQADRVVESHTPTFRGNPSRRLAEGSHCGSGATFPRLPASGQRTEWRRCPGLSQSVGGIRLSTSQPASIAVGQQRSWRRAENSRRSEHRSQRRQPTQE